MTPKEIQRELENLTSGGSEFYHNPRMCLDYLKDRKNTTLHFAKKAKKAELENRELRLMLAIAHAGVLLYTDDGEIQDNRIHPCIDYKRDSVEMIKEKLYIRNMNNPEVKKFLKTLNEDGIEK